MKNEERKMPKKKDIKKEETKDKPYPPAYFMSLTLENIRCFSEKQTLHLSKDRKRPSQWTVILGDNGVGKTTLLQCLIANESEIHSKGAKPKFLRLSEVEEDMDNLLRLKCKDGNIKGDIFVDSKLVSNSDGRRLENCNVSINRKSGKLEWTVHEISKNITCFGYGASRRFSPAILSAKKKSQPSESLFNDDTFLMNPEEWLLGLEYIVRISESKYLERKAEEQRNKVENILVKVLPNVNHLGIWKPISEGLKPRIAFNTVDGDVFMDDLSLGYKTMITWIVDLAANMYDRYPDSNDPLAEPAVVLVDEIDLHMHPRWQREIMSYLTERFPNTQFIVTAHSPLIVQAAEDANIVVLKREGDHVIIDNDPESVRGWRVDQILTSDLYDLDSARSPEIQKLLDERRKILSKSELTKKDIKKVKELESEIGFLPSGETEEEIKAMDVIKRAADFLVRQEKGKLDKAK